MSLTIKYLDYEFTGEIDDVVEAYNKEFDYNTIEVYSSDTLVLITGYFNDHEITFSDYPYEIIPETRYKVFSKIDKQYVPKSLIYGYYFKYGEQTSSSEYDISYYARVDIYPTGFIYDEPLLTIASMLGALHHPKIISATKIKNDIRLYGDNVLFFTMNPTFQNMFTLDYMPADDFYFLSWLQGNGVISQIIDFSKPFGMVTLLNENDETMIVEPPSQHINIANNSQTLNTFIDNFITSKEFKDCYNNLLNNTPFKKYFTQYINNLPVDIFDNETIGLLYDTPMYESYLILYYYTFEFIMYKISQEDKDLFTKWINNNKCIRDIVDEFDVNSLIGSCLEYANRIIKHIVVSYIKTHSCDDPANYILEFIKNLPLMNDSNSDTTNTTVNTTDTTTDTVVNTVDTTNTTADTVVNTVDTTNTTADKVHNFVQQPPPPDKSNSNNNTIYIILIIVIFAMFIMFICIILFVSIGRNTQSKTSN